MENSEMPVMYYWTIYSGEWMDGGECNSLQELTAAVVKIERMRLTSPSMRLCVRYKYDDGFFTITPYYDRDSWRTKFRGDAKDSASQNWLICELNKLTK